MKNLNVLIIIILLGGIVFIGCEKKQVTETGFINPYEHVGIDHNENLNAVMSKLTSIPKGNEDIKTEVAKLLKKNGIGDNLKNSSIEEIKEQFPDFPRFIEELNIENWIESFPYSKKFKEEALITVEQLQSFSSVSELDKLIKERELNASALFEGEELRLMYEHLAVARYTVKYWSSVSTGGEGGFDNLVATSQKLKGTAGLKGVNQINGWKVLACDCIGGWMGGPFGYIGASAISAIMQM